MNLEDDSHQSSSVAPDPCPARDPWALARADYLAGGSATEVCERHGLSVSTLRWRARHEGWRRADFRESPVDAPFTERVSLDDPDADVTWDGKAPAADLATSAWLHAQSAIRRGKMIEARGWVRLHRELSDIARHEAKEAKAAASPHRGQFSAALEHSRAKLMESLRATME